MDTPTELRDRIAAALDAIDDNNSHRCRAILAETLRVMDAHAPMPAPASGRISVDAGALQMVRNALARDAEEGRVVRREMLDALDATAAPAPLAEPTHAPMTLGEAMKESGLYAYDRPGDLAFIHCVQRFAAIIRRNAVGAAAAPQAEKQRPAR